MKELKHKNLSPTNQKELYLKGAELIRNLEQNGPVSVSNESEGLKFLLKKFGLLEPEMEKEEDLSFDDMMSGYVFQKSRKFFLGDSLVLRNKLLGEIEKVDELFKKQ
jgi:hypothetical protein